MKRWSKLLPAVLVLAACGARGAQTPEQVARAWSAALNKGDDEAAAALFAPGAEVVQNGTLVLRGARDAVAWNAALPCGGAIVDVSIQSPQQVLVVFRLKDRPGHTCDAPEQDAAAVFRVANGKITLWHQVPPPPQGQAA